MERVRAVLTSARRRIRAVGPEHSWGRTSSPPAVLLAQPHLVLLDHSEQSSKQEGSGLDLQGTVFRVLSVEEFGEDG